MNEEKERKEKTAKQYKVGISESGFNELNKFLSSANQGSRKRIRTPDVLAYAVGKLDNSDIQILRERSYTASDKLEILLETINLEQPEHRITKEELLLRMLETYQSGTKVRGSKQLKLKD